ncbi:MFS transporter [Arthrobacter sp. I2-34]|uniref:MFS transporter n=1 Tax=Arthrobacter hankyongi TaxID=2904801 RepID=A0ABS9L4C0_9MICC|nr:MFS transporter [Arthrobacter hankyongi]MCG2621470.1 MFS transporter [Arthrobacter hankyongi]
MRQPAGAPVAASNLRAPLGPWRAITAFGLVSLAADMVYEGARSVAGPLLASLGATALVVGLATGAGEGIALAFRLLFGPLADRTRKYWTLTIAGYAMTAVCVPLLAVAPFAGSAGLALAVALIWAERAGKAVRSPAKSALLSYAAGAVGRGKGMAVHKLLDQLGAFAGPLLVAAAVGTTAAIWPAMALLAVPGAASIALLLWLRRRVPDMGVYEPADTTAAAADSAAAPAAERTRLHRAFYLFAAAAGATTAGLVTFGVIAFHLTESGMLPVVAVPLVYAGAMLAEAAAALATGWVYDRRGAGVLLVLPALVALVPGLAFAPGLGAVLAGILIWGIATGIQDSTVKALVADLVPAERRATAYGVFAAVQGGAALAGGALAGGLYGHTPVLVAVVAALQLAALVLLAAALRARPVRRRPGTAA